MQSRMLSLTLVPECDNRRGRGQSALPMKCGKLAAQIGCRLRGLVPSGLEIALTVRNRAQRYRMSRPHLERVHSIYIAVTADSDLTVR
jgi:hypothetical protein